MSSPHNPFSNTYSKQSALQALYAADAQQPEGQRMTAQEKTTLEAILFKTKGGKRRTKHRKTKSRKLRQ